MTMRLDWLELRIPPLVVALLAAASTIGFELASGAGPLAASRPAVLIGAVLAAAGSAVAVAGVLAFRRARTTVDPLHPERSADLVTDGIYRYSRNPMYLGFVIGLLGIAVALCSLLGIALALATARFLHRFQIEPEERHLARRFGRQFEQYCRAVPRWLV